MSRGVVVRPIRTVNPDPIYNSKIISKLINAIMLDGKKVVAMKIVYDAIEAILEDMRKKYSEENNEDSSSNTVVVKWFMEYILNQIAPTLEIKTKRVGGANYQIPCPVMPKRALYLAITWLVSAIQTRKERGSAKRLSSEMLDIVSGRGECLKKKETVHKTAEANKAFAHFANR
jgi:small subunit ribosomal protein S7